MLSKFNKLYNLILEQITKDEEKVKKIKNIYTDPIVQQDIDTYFIFSDVNSYLADMFSYPLYVKPESNSRRIASTIAESVANWFLNCKTYLTKAESNKDSGLPLYKQDRTYGQVYKAEIDFILNQDITEFYGNRLYKFARVPIQDDPAQWKQIVNQITTGNLNTKAGAKIIEQSGLLEKVQQVVIYNADIYVPPQLKNDTYAITESEYDKLLNDNINTYKTLKEILSNNKHYDQSDVMYIFKFDNEGNVINIKHNGNLLPENVVLKSYVYNFIHEPTKHPFGDIANSNYFVIVKFNDGHYEKRSLTSN